MIKDDVLCALAPFLRASESATFQAKRAETVTLRGELVTICRPAWRDEHVLFESSDGIKLTYGDVRKAARLYAALEGK